MRRLTLNVEAIALAACMRVGLRLLPFASVAALAAATRATRARRHEDVTACVVAARHAASRVAHPTCLFHSLIALALLRRRGHAAALHVGARRTAGFEAHAWLTVDGVSVDGTADNTFVSLCRFPRGGAS